MTVRVCPSVLVILLSTSLQTNMKSFRQTIFNFQKKIASGSIEPKKFSDLPEYQKPKNLAALKKAVEILSGNEPVAILRSLLNAPKYAPGVLATTTDKHQECLNNISQAFNRATNRDEKILLLSLVANTYPSNFLKSVGFHFGSDLFALARRYPRLVASFFYPVFFFVKFINPFFFLLLV